jgi:hypothetical protein
VGLLGGETSTSHLTHLVDTAVFHYTLEVRFHCGSFFAEVQLRMIDVARLLPRMVRANPELAAQLAWTQAAGPGLRRNAVPAGLQGRVLTVSVADALWQKQLQSMAGELLFRVNTLLGGNKIDEIVFRIAPRDLPEPEPRRTDVSTHEPNELPTELLFAANSIADDDLRARFLRAADNLISRRDAQQDD